MSLRRSAGFSPVEGVLIGVAIILVGVAGYAVFTSKNDGDSPAASEQAEAPEVNSTDDLDAADQALDETDLDASTSDSTELDAQADDF